MAEESNKLTLKRLKAPINKFIKVALPTDMERLQKHHSNMLKYQHTQQWDRLHQEHINASRTVQQLRANIREMEKLCTRVRAEDAADLELLVKPVRDRALAATQDFLSVQSNTVPQPTSTPPPAPQLSSDQSSECHADNNVEAEPASLRQMQLYLPEIPADQSAAESWDNLKEDIKELNGLVTEFSVLVHSQQEKIDRIEDNVNTAAANVVEGTKSLGKAVGYKLSVLPVAGALLGSVLGGPLGLLAGLKAASVAVALGGGALGFAGGNLVQKHRKSRVDQQMKHLTTPPADPPADVLSKQK
ncbi:syntaxin-17 [Thalassophryne amazonica]|uniref:syntaxin-17 n=1 Tax=Thalassophryne amazonica TaxID=390379 RepID=UPI001471ECBF|nr:syntaxin-17 [Thalassophryne amazonica]XP_034030790.1 syntaxin-17 [Thalassophryne amazonica]XP_034030791.1 syntaxin-17 [Thalassophryne amazonica]XP_034030792.1 syntaxin-17 [Thalassophryne amazonica]XP_034030793.1 syntaxin-17 [Thalassophryne amazonica]